MSGVLNDMRRRAVGLVAALLLLAGLGGAVASTQAASTAQPAKIVFVDVGQGDGVVMKIGGKIIVSDAGELFPERVDEILRSLGAKQIDVAILSHAHDDHVKNFVRLVRDKQWKIKRVVSSESAWWKGTKTNRELTALLKDVPHDVVTAGQTFHWGGATWKILGPQFGQSTGRSSAAAANASVVYLLTVNGVQALFTGDIEESVALSVASELHTMLHKRVDIFLATHHGSKKGSTPELLDAAKPRWAVVSVGDGNSFHHPTREALNRLEGAGASIWCTATNGTVTARISAAGRLTWRADGQRAPWWSARDDVQNGRCARR